MLAPLAETTFLLMIKRDNDCPSGQSFYRCARPSFVGCCSVDACAESGCPDDSSSLQTALGGGFTPPAPTLSSSTSTSTPTAKVTSLRPTSVTTSASTASTSSGGASITTPTNVLAIPGTASIIGSDDPASSSTNTSSPDSTSSPDADVSQTTAPKTNSSKAIVGGIVGGVIGLCVLLLLLWLFLRHRRRVLAYLSKKQGKENRRSSFESGPDPQLIVSEKKAGSSMEYMTAVKAAEPEPNAKTATPPYDAAAFERNPSLSPVYEQHSPHSSTFANSTIMSIPRSAPHSPQSIAIGMSTADPSIIELPGSTTLPNEFPNTPAFSGFSELPTPDLHRSSVAVPSPLRIGNRFPSAFDSINKTSPSKDTYQYGTTTPINRATLLNNRASMPASTAQLRQAHHVMSWASYDNEPVHEGSSPDMVTGLRPAGVNAHGNALGLGSSMEFSRLRTPHSSPDMGGSAWTQISKDQLK